MYLWYTFTLFQINHRVFELLCKKKENNTNYTLKNLSFFWGTDWKQAIGKITMFAMSRN